MVEGRLSERNKRCKQCNEAIRILIKQLLADAKRGKRARISDGWLWFYTFHWLSGASFGNKSLSEVETRITKDTGLKTTISTEAGAVTAIRSFDIFC